ncbi:MAG: hypothetical protein ABF461_03300 [Zymomonas mobilis subsp. pomaceae]|uniref:hypothetical protein n=1 Tax=Zymomonas mobilis TaxID=542 RepID=UPI00059FC4BA|nr:hypothetical protein [Zymomonas mobilis]MDX5949482.1 hypothetical protein [Zymomonas mobilis subsp. pomaceae]
MLIVKKPYSLRDVSGKLMLGACNSSEIRYTRFDARRFWLHKLADGGCIFPADSMTKALYRR